MRTLYFDCGAGASGDMIAGSLADLLDDPAEVGSMISSAGIPGITVKVTGEERSGISGTRVHIIIDGHEEGDEHHHIHRGLSDIISIIEGLNVSERVRKDASAIYRIIAGAESEVHGKPVDLVHFHEVGALDAVADIVGVCMMIERLDPERILASPIRTGFGQVRCAHGILPVPAPATAYILRDMPCYAGEFEGEFCTPTGAAILKHFAEDFVRMPEMVFDGVGYGIGKKEYAVANVVRTFIGDVASPAPDIDQIDCDIDDMSPEDLGGIVDRLLEEGAVDAYVKPCIMKKSRPGFELTCLSRIKDTERLSAFILRETSTIGVRVHTCMRYTLTSETFTVPTRYGDVRVKVSKGYGITKWKPESDDLRRLAEENGVPVSAVRDAVRYTPGE